MKKILPISFILLFFYSVNSSASVVASPQENIYLKEIIKEQQEQNKILIQILKEIKEQKETKQKNIDSNESDIEKLNNMIQKYIKENNKQIEEYKLQHIEDINKT